MEVWTAGADGSSPRQLTQKPGRYQGSPSWSPDGRTVAFDSLGESGRWDIWTIDADGSAARRLTRDPGDENAPTWSRDGRFVYYAARSTGATTADLDVRRIPAGGATAERITKRGAGASHESMDGKTLFFTKRLGDGSSLFAQPLAEGPEREIAKACIFAIAVGPAGVYTLECYAGSDAPLLLRDPATGKGRLFGKLTQAAGPFTVSPDGKTVLYTRAVGEGSDLMMIENFR